MELRLVEYFVAVVDQGGITRAARALYVAQPSLSQAIQQLERELGVVLFDRSGRQLRLTAAGEAFLGPARSLLGDVGRASARVRAVRELRTGRLDIAVVSTLAADPLPELTSRLRAVHPGLVVRVFAPGSPADAVGQVRNGQVELCLTTLPVPADALGTRELWEEEIVAVLPPALAAELPDPLPIEALATIPVVVEFSDAGGRVALDGALEGAIGPVVVECAHRQAIWELVMHGAGATFLPRRIAESELRDVVVRSIEPPVWRGVGLVFRPGPASPAASALLEVADLMRRERSPEPSR
ncbi:MAG TPA: LysR family transcriptional regulator [Pseudonocardia sp.]|jgi:DNA-binding transcriptional LysR family regulator|nr:LysR family transcriptional regulator [Pseudonocardia sp.]